MQLRRIIPILLTALLPLLYLLHLESDPIAGLFGVLWSDEGAYLLPARNLVLYGNQHLFPAEYYMPEFTAPLLYRFGQLTMTHANTVWGVRFGMVLCVLLAMGLIARLAARHHGNREAGIHCFAMLLLTPMLFFYARTGLSEGLQFLTMAGIFWVLCGLYQARQPGRIRLYAMLAAVLIALLFLTKVTSVAACIGLTVATLAAISRHPHKYQVTMWSGLAGAIAFALLFFTLLDGNYNQWHLNNFGNSVYGEVVPHDLGTLWVFLRKHFIGLYHFLTLMPIFAFGFPALLLAADRKRDGFLWLLWLATIVTLAVESFFSGELRRSFFGLSMLMVLAGFTIDRFTAVGTRSDGNSMSRRLSWAMIACFGAGLLFFLLRAVVSGDIIYLILGVTYALVLANILFLRGEHLKRPRQMLLTLCAIVSLVPIFYQSFWAPRSIEIAIRQVEEAIPPDASISGAMLPWYFLGMQRRMIFTNCRADNWSIANDIEELPPELTQYFLIHTQMANEGTCLPPHFGQYEKILEFRIFYPFNKGIGYGGSRRWALYQPFTLYKRRD
jgi:hypothetical protein